MVLLFATFDPVDESWDYLENRLREVADVADPQLDGLFASLEAGYESAAAREDDAGAADLAFGFLQDRSLIDELCARGHALAWEGLTVPVIAAGRDYVVAGRAPALLVPAHAAELVAREDVAPAKQVDSTLLTVLRRLARRGTSLELVTRTGVRAGTLISASHDHVLLDGFRGRWAVGSEALIAVRLPLLDSADEL